MSKKERKAASVEGLGAAEAPGDVLGEAFYEARREELRERLP